MMTHKIQLIAYGQNGWNGHARHGAEVVVKDGSYAHASFNGLRKMVGHTVRGPAMMLREILVEKLCLATWEHAGRVAILSLGENGAPVLGCSALRHVAGGRKAALVGMQAW